MKTRNFILAGAMLAIYLAAPSASAQVLFTGSTAGKGNGNVYVFGTGAGSNGAYGTTDYSVAVLGLANRFDFVAGGGATVFEGRALPFATAGGVIGFPTSAMGFDAMAYQAFIVPVANTSLAPPAFGNTNIVVSRNLSVGGFKFTPYTGQIWTYNLGPGDRHFSAAEVIRQTPLGAYIPIGKRWGFTAEYDFGKTHGFGAALNYSFEFGKKK